MDAQVCEFTESYGVAHFKRVNFMVCKSHFHEENTSMSFYFSC